MVNSMRTLCLSAMFIMATNCFAQVYKDAMQPIERRVEDLLSRMTLEEKVNQLRHIHGGQVLNGDNTLDEEKMRRIIGDKGYGAIEGLQLNAEEMADYTHTLQKYCVEQTRLGIPIFTISESLHGAVQGGCTIFPQAVALGCTFNPTLAYKMTRATASELHAMGVNHVLSPTIDVIRELRWGRVEESFGEDPFLVSQMGVNEVNGYIDGKVSPMLKVFGPHGVPTSGLNLASTEANERDLREVFLKPYEMAIKKTGVTSVMTAYNATNRIPNTASHWLLTELLRDEWGFKGYTYSDWGAVAMLYGFHKVAPNAEEAVKMALMAGTDLEASSDCYALLPKMVREGRIDEKYVDVACSRVLYAKFKAGLFENPYGLPREQLKENIHTKEHVALSRAISEESVVLVKNENQLLPLDMDKLKSVAVIGPNADQVQFGDYTWSRNNADGITPLQGIRKYADKRIAINYAKGCDLVSDSKAGFTEAIETARKSDVAILFVGSASASLARDYSNCTCGEGYDLTDLQLTGVQGDLVKEIHKTGKPVVLVLVTGRPFTIEWEAQNIPAILFQWYGGECEGDVIADVLFGKVNPSGSLCYTIPKSVGHLPAHYNRLPSDNGIYHQPGTINKPGRDYVFSSPTPLWAFGHGLSYTNFIYENIKTDRTIYGMNDTIIVSADITNTGERDGRTTMQVYVRDMAGSIVMPVKQLKGFNKVAISAGKTENAMVRIPVAELGLYNLEMKYVVEPGDFNIMVGMSSDSIVANRVISVKDVNLPSELAGAVSEESHKTMNESATLADLAQAEGNAKKITVKGDVRDVQSTTIADAIVRVKGHKDTVKTDARGRFSIKCTEASILIFTKKGFAPLEIRVDGQRTINATMINQM